MPIMPFLPTLYKLWKKSIDMFSVPSQILGQNAKATTKVTLHEPLIIAEKENIKTTVN